MHSLAVAKDPHTLSMKQLIRMLHARAVRSYKQPIINIREQRTIGYEGLSRGIHPDTGEIVVPDVLFHSAKANGLTPEIDRMCSDMAIAAFAKYARKGELLFVNFDASSLEEVNAGISWILNKTIALGLRPESIAIEIVESRVTNDASLMRFVEWHREFGFKIVLDDFGAQHSNLDRLHMLKPDIVKIDQNLVHGMATDHYKRAIVESIVILSEKVGALSLVEGAESIEDILECVAMGVNLLQGFYFSEPIRAEAVIGAQLDARIAHVFNAAVEQLQQKWRDKQEEARHYEEIVAYFARLLGAGNVRSLDEALERIVMDAVGVECAYVVNSDGIQVTHTHFQSEEQAQQMAGIRGATPKGSNHFLKHYFLKMKNSNKQRAMTRPYVSLATGNVCRTMGQVLQGHDGQVYYLFVDFVL